MPAASDADVYRRMVRRIAVLVVLFGLAGAVLAASRKGIPFGLAFLLGAGLSGASLWRWKKMAEMVGSGGSRRSALGWVMQLILVVAAAFVIIVYLKATPVAVFLGLLVSAAAIIVAILIELIWNTNSG